MTSKKTDKNADDVSAEESADVAPYLSTKKEAPETTEDSSMFTPIVLTIALAAAIFIIFYGGEYRNLMAGLGFDIEEPAAGKSVTTTKPADSMITAVSTQTNNGVMPPVDDLLDNTATSTNEPEGLHTATTVPDNANETGRNTALSPPAATATIAPAAGKPYYPGAYTYAPAPPYAYNYPSAYSHYPPPADYYGYDRSNDDYARPGTNQSYEETLKQQEAMLKQMDIEYAETRKAYEERVHRLKQERQQTRLAYKETLKKRRLERDQARDQARKSYEESLRNRPEITSPY